MAEAARASTEQWAAHTIQVALPGCEICRHPRLQKQEWASATTIAAAMGRFHPLPLGAMTER